jgi:hypothetical protein
MIRGEFAGLLAGERSNRAVFSYSRHADALVNAAGVFCMQFCMQLALLLQPLMQLISVFGVNVR